MQFYYGDKNLFRALDEAQFWKHQEAEHTVVIRAIAPGLEKEFVFTLQEFELEFNSTYAEIVKYIESAVHSKGMVSHGLKTQMIGVVKQSILQSERFVEFLGKMLQKSKAVKENLTAQTVINHIIRESQYFIGIDQLMLS